MYMLLFIHSQKGIYFHKHMFINKYSYMYIIMLVTYVTETFIFKQVNYRSWTL